MAGVSAETSRPSASQRYIQTLREFGYTGEIYPLHPAGGEFMGMKIYPGVNDVPGPVDLVISAVGAKFTPQLIRECVEKKVRAVHLFTSGFSEIEDEIGSQLEAEILSIARKGGVRLIGPNCMGLYCPAGGLTFAAMFEDGRGFPTKQGPAGMIVQSGGNCIYLIRDASKRGVFFSKAVSYGNAADIDETELLEYMTEDPDTQLIGMYIEGVKDGQRFMKAMKRAALIKPLIVYKAGLTETGARACATHTSAVAGSPAIWQGALKQAGAVQVFSMQELADMAVTFTHMPQPAGKNTVIVGTGGGVAVKAADDITTAGLHLQVLSPEVRMKLNNIYGTEAGSIYRNPVDIPPFGGPENLIRSVSAIADAPETHILIMHFPFDIWALVRREVPLQFFMEGMARLAGSIKKPLAVVLHNSIEPAARRLEDETKEKLVALGYPVYPSVSRAAVAVSNYIGYHEWRAGR